MSVLAIYRRRLYVVGDSLEICQLESGPDVDYGDPDLVIEPTDREVADAENLGEFYGVEGARLTKLRKRLAG